MKHNRQATRALHTGSRAWHYLRLEVLERDLYRCQACGHIGNEVDHIDNDSHNNDPSNLQCLCAGCHSRKTAQEMAGKTFTVKGCDAQGIPYTGHWRQ